MDDRLVKCAVSQFAYSFPELIFVEPADSVSLECLGRPPLNKELILPNGILDKYVGLDRRAHIADPEQSRHKIREIRGRISQDL